MVSIRGGPAWIKVWVDGKLQVDGRAGTVYHAGQDADVHGNDLGRGPDRLVGRHALHAQRRDPRALGKPGVPETWLFAPPARRSRPQPHASVAGARSSPLAERLQGALPRRGA